MEKEMARWSVVDSVLHCEKQELGREGGSKTNSDLLPDSLVQRKWVPR